MLGQWEDLHDSPKAQWDSKVGCSAPADHQMQGLILAVGAVAALGLVTEEDSPKLSPLILEVLLSDLGECPLSLGFEPRVSKALSS